MLDEEKGNKEVTMWTILCIENSLAHNTVLLTLGDEWMTCSELDMGECLLTRISKMPF